MIEPNPWNFWNLWNLWNLKIQTTFFSRSDLIVSSS